MCIHEMSQFYFPADIIPQRTQYLNAQNTFHELFNMEVVPIVNENDTLAVSVRHKLYFLILCSLAKRISSPLQEIKFGDNDTLSAITAGMVQADYLFLMTDVDCLYDKNPRTHSSALPIEVVEDISTLAADVSTAGSSLGTGGMSTKIIAARLATSAGVTTVITRSSKPGNIVNIVRYDQALTKTSQPASTEFLPVLKAPLHTRFLPDLNPIRDRSFWLLHGLAPHGTVYIDEGAHQALISKAGLLPAGVMHVEGHFAQQEAVRIVVIPSSPSPSSQTQNLTPPSLPSEHDQNSVPSSAGMAKMDVEVGRALVNYSSAEIKRIKGLRSTQILGVLGYADSEYVALRQNVSLAKSRVSRPVTPAPDSGRVGSGAKGDAATSAS